MADNAGMETAKSNDLLNFAKTVTITAAGTLSAAADLEGRTPVGVFLPATFTGTVLNFHTATSLAGTYAEMQDGAGAAYAVTVAAGKYVPLDPSKFAGMRYLKIESDQTEAADRVITLALRRV